MIFTKRRQSISCSNVHSLGLKYASSLATSLIVPFFLTALWTLSSKMGWVSQDILPSPHDVYASLKNMFNSGVLISNAGSSFSRLLWGALAGITLGVILGVWMGSSDKVEEFILPTFKLFNLVPPLGWIPLLTMLIGIENSMKIIIIAKSVMTPVTLNTLQGMRSVSPKFKEVTLVHQLSVMHKARLLYIPTLLPFIFAEIRYGRRNGWMALVAVELLASSEGLGYLLSEGGQLFQLDVVMAMVVVIGVSGWLIDKLLENLETRIQQFRYH